MFRYSIDLAYRYYDNVAEVRQYKRYQDSIMHFAASYGSQSSQTKEEYKARKKLWDRYVDSVNPNRQDRKTKQKKQMKKLTRMKDVPVIKSL